MVRTRNQGASPGGLQALESPFFKRTRKMPKKKVQPEVEPTTEPSGGSATSAHLQSIVTYAAPDTTSPSVSPQPEESRSESPPPEADSRSTSPPFIPPPSNAGTTSSRWRPEAADAIKKQPTGRASKKTPGPTTHQSAGSSTRRTTRRTGASQQETSDADAEDDQPARTSRTGRTSTTTPKSVLGKRGRFQTSTSDGSDEDGRPVKRNTQPTMRPSPFFQSPLSTLNKSFTPSGNVNTDQIYNNTPAHSYQPFTPFGTRTPHNHGHHPGQNSVKEQSLVRVNQTSPQPESTSSTTSSTTHTKSAHRNTSSTKKIATMAVVRRVSADGLDVEATVAQRMNEPKCQIKKPKMILPGFPGYDEELESDEEMMEEAQDRVKYGQNKDLKFLARYLESEKKKEVECRKAGKPYDIPTPIRNATKITRQKSNIGSTSAKNALRTVVNFATRNPSKTLPDSEDFVAFLEDPKSSGQAAIMPANHTDEQTVDTHATTRDTTEGDSSFGAPQTSVIVATSEPAKRRFMNPNIRQRSASSTYSQPLDTQSESDGGPDSDVDTTTYSDKDQSVAESDSEVAPPETPRISEPDKTQESRGWGLFSAVKSIVASPVKFFAGSQQAAVKAPLTVPTNKQDLDLNYQPLKPGRVNGRAVTPKTATARRTQQSFKSKIVQSERKASLEERPFVPMHERGAAEVKLALTNAKKEFRKQQEKKKAAQRKEAEENHDYRHIDNHEGTFTVPDYSSDSDTEEEIPESPLARKIVQSKTVSWSSDVQERPPFLKDPGPFATTEERMEWSNYKSVMAPDPNPNTKPIGSISPGIWALQTQWYEEGKSVEECAILEAEYHKKESTNKAAWDKQRATRRGEEREIMMALERQQSRGVEKSEQSRKVVAAGKTTNHFGDGSELNRDSLSVNETHSSNETNPNNASLEATSTSSIGETRIWTETNPDNSSVNEISPAKTPKPRYVLQRENPWTRSRTPEEKEEEKKRAETSDKQEFEDWKQSKRANMAQARKEPLGEIHNLQTTAVLEHPSVSAAKANATKYSPKKPSQLRTVHTASPTHSEHSIAEYQHITVDETVEEFLAAGEILLQKWIADSGENVNELLGVDLVAFEMATKMMNDEDLAVYIDLITQE